MTLLLVTLAGFLSWLLSTAAAGGGEFIFISAVAFLLGGRAVAPVVTVSNLLGVPSRVVLFRERIDWSIVRWFLLGAVPGGFVGSWLFARTTAAWLQLVVAAFLLSAPLQYRFGERERSFRVRLWWFFPAGLLVAFLSGLIGGMGPVLNPLYLNYGTVKEEMIGTKSINSFAMHLTKLGTYAALGAFRTEYLLYGATVGLTAIAANWMAARWLEHISPHRFRQVVIWAMFLSGAVLAWRDRAVIEDLWRRASH
jgi:uncharacterized membrane protein YfcA